MNLPYDENEEIEELRELEEKKERERRLREAKKEARRAEKASGAEPGSRDHTAVVRVFLCLIAILALLVALMYGGLLLWEQFKTAGDEPSENTAPVISNAVVYSQEEVDAMIAAAVAEAKSNGSAEVLDAVKNSFVQGMTTTDMLRALYPDDIVVASGGRYHFVPIDRSWCLRISMSWTAESFNICKTVRWFPTRESMSPAIRAISTGRRLRQTEWSLHSSVPFSEATAPVSW